MAISSLVFRAIGLSFGVPSVWASSLGGLVSLMGRFGFEPIPPYGKFFRWGREYAERNMANLGVGRERAYQAMRDMGLSYRRQDFLRAYGKRLHAATTQAYLRTMPGGTTIERGLLTDVGLDFPERLSANIPEEWFHLVRYQYDDGTGTFHDAHITVSTDRSMTPDRITERAWEILSENIDRYRALFGFDMTDIGTVTYVGTIHHEGYAYG